MSIISTVFVRLEVTFCDLKLETPIWHLKFSNSSPDSWITFLDDVAARFGNESVLISFALDKIWATRVIILITEN